MKKAARLVVVFLLFASALGLAKDTKTDTEIKKEIIKDSIAAYKGSCPCPYSVDRAGKNCGNRSAYSKPGGESPICYDRDVTQKMVDDYRKKNRLQ